MNSAVIGLQLVAGLGILNVWLLRYNKVTNYRGAQATSLKEEFQSYGLPVAVFYVVGFLKITSALSLIAGIWCPQIVSPAASVLAVLMVGALLMHVKVKDPLIKSLPAFLMLLISASIVMTYAGLIKM